ncbi:hypothetical protein IGI04_028279 [Brassica rapa subsp. trilocularis]|uniref:RRM domain-containing protein n=1 Tax=Brassica rapa subsp. trilocularis TaxID=1813537 RepID=A0ABQ7L1G9_BRACM|nr:hypothetical protein IGI04_028279 [Brassica rapa subsp. trilocularis]
MADSLSMSLDEMVKRSKAAKKSAGKGVSRGGAKGAGRGAGVPVRRGPLAVKARPSSFSNKASSRIWDLLSLNRRKKNLPWQNGLFEESMRSVGVTGIEVGTTVYVTNLDQGVTNEDIRELFGEIGEMKRYAIHYDQNGRPNGSAEVVYMRRSDAFQAMKRYNNVLLDGRSMKLEILGGKNEVAPVAARVNVTGLNGRMKRTVSIGQGIRGGRGRGSAAPSMRRLPIGNQQGGGVRSGRGGFRGRGRGQAGGGRGNKGGRGGKKAVEKSAEELDKDLETYHAEAMNIS